MGITTQSASISNPRAPLLRQQFEHIGQGLHALIMQLPPQMREYFGRLRVANDASVFVSSQPYNEDPHLWQIKNTMTGTAAYSTTQRALEMTPSTSVGVLTRQSIPYCIYEPGRGVYLAETVIIGKCGLQPLAADEGQYREWGIKDATNGIFLRKKSDLTDATIEHLFIVVRKNGVDEEIPRSDWNECKAQSLDTDGFVLDTTKDNYYYAKAGWLGTAGFEIGVLIDGNEIPFHKFFSTNKNGGSFIQTISLPLAFTIENKQALVTAGDKMTPICCVMFSEGGFFEKPALALATKRPITSLVNIATEAPILAIRPKATYNTLVNRMQLFPIEISAYATANCEINVYFFPVGTATATIWGTAPLAGDWAGIGNGAPETGIEVAFTGTLAAGALGSGVARLLDTLYLVTSGGSARGTIQKNLSFFYPFTLDIDGSLPAYIVITGLSASGACSATAKITCGEIR